jgi:hypothetical protein
LALAKKRVQPGYDGVPETGRTIFNFAPHFGCRLVLLQPFA